jgi:acetyl-CoA carboxylase biotin carboxylase subunit
MFHKVLIADRGEIAVRIIRSLKEMGIATVAVYSVADQQSLHVRMADEALCIGPAGIRDSYLNFSAILSAAGITRADAIHPGYCPLAENLEFVESCHDMGVTFIGTGINSMSLMADKVAAKKIAASVGVEVVPGSLEPIRDEREALSVADSLGFPIILKAVGGGGGRGIKVVGDPGSFALAFEQSKKEAQSYLKNPGIYIEKYLQKARHIEFQIVADNAGNTIHLGERDCTIQRRYQKIIEESPAFDLADSRRDEMGRAAVCFAQSVGYSNIGTVEFLLTEDQQFYFLEMNTRIQVEHAITEMVTGIDVVKQQIRLAAGEPLTISQEDVVFSGHSIECRITAEDPFRFTPSSGTVTQYIPSGGPGVRVDSAIYCGAYVNPYYDSLVAKLIVRSTDRKSAIERMRRALSEFVIEGIETTIPLYKKILVDPAFTSGYNDASFLDKYI